MIVFGLLEWMTDHRSLFSFLPILIKDFIFSLFHGSCADSIRANFLAVVSNQIIIYQALGD